MDKELHEVLKDLGFKDKEIKIYLALLKEESLTVLQIGKEARIDRTTIYDVLERLIDKGVVSSSVKNKTKYFTALNPNELLIHFKEKYSSLEKILPELNKLSTKSKPKIKFNLFQGKEGLKSVINELIEEKTDYKVIGMKKEYEEILSYFTKNALLKLNQSKVKEIAIVGKEAKFKKLRNGIYRYLDEALLSPITTLIYNDKVIFFIWIEPYFALSIENKEFRTSQEEYFNLLWKLAKNS